MLDAIKVGREHNLDYVYKGLTPPPVLHMKYKFYEKTIYSLLKKTIGIENGRFFPTAGAAIPPAVQEFVLSVGINMVAGYGLTESTATVACENDNDHVVGSVGRIMPHVQVRIGENNEIMLRGEGITHGYYKKEAATKAAFTEDGWFHTGDAGYIKDEHLFLTERIKDLFKTSNGKYIAPQAIEAKLVVDRYIDQISIIADERKFVSALIIPEYKLVKEYAAKKGIRYESMEELLQKPEIIDLFRERIDTLQQQFAHYEQIKRFTLLPHPFSMERGELTNTLKIKRNVLNKNYAAVDRGGEYKQLAVDPAWANLEVEAPAANNDPAFINEVVRPINAQDGDLLPVSAFKGIEDGTWEQGTAKYEKRGVAAFVPEWNAENCIQCNKCAYVCPHASIRPFVLDAEEQKGANFTQLKAVGKAFDGMTFRIQVDVLDCLGCGNCADVCPATRRRVARL